MKCLPKWTVHCPSTCDDWRALSISSHGSCFLWNCCIKCKQFCFILSSTKSKGGGSRTWKTSFEHNERTNRIFAFFAFFVGKDSPVASHKCVYSSKKTKGVRISEEFEQYSVISDHDLDQIYKEVTGADTNVSNGGFLTPNIGRRRFIGTLRSRGLRVQRWRVSNCLRRLDPVGTALRWRLVIYRQNNNVPTPNSLWHFDSAPKLIWWKHIVHVCLDGFSRLITHCRCCDNNKAETVLRLFEESTRSYGLPSRARSDYRMGNILVAQLMLERRGLNRGSIITGSSVHSCRGERAHWDVACIQTSPPPQ